MNPEVYIVDGLRTPIGGRHKTLRDFNAVQLAAHLLTGLTQRISFDPQLIDEVVIGNVVSAGTGQNLARQAAHMAKLPQHIPAYTVNYVCGSGLLALSLGIRSIQAGQAHYMLVGGTESVSHSPLFATEDPAEQKDSAFWDGLYCQMTQKSMGELVEGLCRRHRITRLQQEKFALSSHQKAVAARRDFFSEEIYPLRHPQKGRLTLDDKPRANLTLARLKSLPPVFKKNGRVTAATACSPADGAALLAVGSSSFIKKHKIKPKARILSFFTTMVDPKVSFESDVAAIQACLKKCDLGLKDIDLFEITEAFAAQVLLTKQTLDLPEERLNLFGGDIALGHPLGAAGTRVLVTLVHGLKTKQLSKGLACISFGGGGVIALIIESVS